MKLIKENRKKKPPVAPAVFGRFKTFSVDTFRSLDRLKRLRTKSS